MPRCRHCRSPLRRDPEEIGARCPRCREPLFEQRANYERVEDGAASAGNLCAVHRRNPAQSTCQRCGNYMCQVCRTRFRARSLCTACVDRVLESQEATPQDGRAHFWQAILAIISGVAGWAITLFGLILIGVGVESDSMPLVGVGGLVILASPVTAIAGVGLGASAIRTRGNHMIMATIGLLLSAFQIGVIIGLTTFSLFLNT